MKKKTAFILIMAMAATAAACGSSTGGGATAGDAIETDYGKVVLGDYKNLSAEKTVYEVTQDAIDSKLEELQYANIQYDEVERVSQDEDVLMVYLTGSVDGEVVYDYSDEEYEIDLGYEEFGEEFDQKLTGVSTGDELEFSISYDEDDEYAEYPGSTVDYQVTVTGIYEVNIPELTDDFVVGTLGYLSMEELSGELYEQVESENNSTSEAELKENLIGQIVEASVVSDYSEEAYESCAESVDESYMSYAQLFGYETVDEIYEMFGMTEDDIRAEVENQLYRMAVVYAISQKEGLSVTDEEYSQGLSQYIEDSGYESEAEFLADYDEDTVRYWLLEDKVASLLEENAVITEVAAQTETVDGLDTEE